MDNRRLGDSKSDRKDFIYYILKQGEHYDLSQDEVIVNAALFMCEFSMPLVCLCLISDSVAGSETTASALSALTNFLLRHPHCYTKLKNEVRSKFNSEEEITLSAMEDLPYMNACLEETMRMFPPAPIGFLRTIQEQGDVIDGHKLPGGVSNEICSTYGHVRKANIWETAVSVSTWCASHSSDNFKDPDNFVPERWLGDPQYHSDKKLASRPFSLGPRGCIGKEYVPSDC